MPFMATGFGATQTRVQPSSSMQVLCVLQLHHEREKSMIPVCVSHQWPRVLRATSVVSLSALLLACGGVGQGGISANNADEVLLTAGEAALVTGSLQSVKYRLKTMSWSVMPLSATNPVLSVLNQDCTVSVKNDSLTPTLATATSPAGSGGSDWQCLLTVFAEPQTMSTDALYQLSLVGVNEVGRQVSYSRQVRVQPKPALGGSSPATPYLQGLSMDQPASICQPGAALALRGTGLPEGTVAHYRWRVVQGPMTVLAGADHHTVGLIVPVVTASTLIVLQLEASALPITPDNTAVYMARAVIHADPSYTFEPCGFN